MDNLKEIFRQEADELFTELDPLKIRGRAVEKGILSADAELPDKEILHQIFAPGFSTSKEVTEVSGRGVGMDVVRRSIETLGEAWK
ncbi:MAG: hypothetical protein GY749_23450 [Desulfobacteraceae bacterium]|nr:hypothetical protein [Desulfobacteraceae bacterium]